MNGFIVNAFFYAPNQEMPVKAMRVDWLDRSQVRHFAAESNRWLSEGLGNSVTTKTVSLPAPKLN